MSQQTAGTKPPNEELTVAHFTNHPEVKEFLNQLHTAFPGGEKPLIVSDALDDQGNQYVNLVQKGGGILGIALVGYTYILEEMGIRFLRLAGTSAGAINTALMTVIGKKEDAKSTQILKDICDLDFFKLVDGHPAARWVIKKFITNADFSIKVKKILTAIILIFVTLLTADFVLLGLQHTIPALSTWTKVSFVLTGFFLLLLAAIGWYLSTLLKRLKDSGFGINPGDYFYDWIKKRMSENGVNNVKDLNQKATAPVPGLKLRVPNPDGLTGLKGDVTFITSELVSQNKIQFPEMCFLFREKANVDMMQPAGFVRASMSIPVFFESYMITEIPCDKDEIKKAWMDTFGEKDPPTTARFVDGGMLSNFPINIFYNPKILIPRLPSFGIDLDDSTPGDRGKTAAGWSPAGYFGRMFNTIRFYYDKDFLIKNKVFEKGIGKIPLAGYNWLNFFISDQDKIDMFVLGARAATEFLKKFNWDDYKNDRQDMQEELNKAHGTIQTHAQPANPSLRNN